MYEVGRHAGHPFAALEYVAGGTLADRLAGRWDPADAARLISVLARAVHHAHADGVVHRDLKPTNILFASDGTAKLADFGLAKLLARDDRLTGTESLLGTPLYMAPEQASRRNAEVGPAADLYALGAILYELLAGRPPFRGADALETIFQAVTREPDALSARRPGLSRDLATVCHKCLEKDPRKRYPSAAALADDLDRFLAGRQVTARPLSGWERAVRWARRNPGWAAAVALLAVVAVGATAAAVGLGRALGRAGKAEAALAERVADLEGATRDRKGELLNSYKAQAQGWRLSGRVGRRYEGLAAIRQAAALANELGKPPETFRELRDEAIACLALPDLKLEREWPTPRPNVDYMNGFSPDLNRYVYPHPDGGLAVAATDDPAKVRRLTCDLAHAPWPMFGPGGRHLVARLGPGPFGSGTGLWDLDDPRSEPKAVLPSLNPIGDPFRRDGRQVALRSKSLKEVILYDTATAAEEGRIGGFNAAHAVVYDPAGRRLAVVDLDHVNTASGTVCVVDLATRQVAHTLPRCEIYLESLSWSDDGRLLAVSWGRSIHVYECGDGPPRLVSVLDGTTNVCIELWFVPGTSLLASKSWDGITRLWDPVLGRQLLEVPGSLMRVSADGTRLAASAVSTYQVWRLDPAAECRLLHHGRAGNRGPDRGHVGVAFDPDGRVLATAGRGGVRFWDAARGTELGPGIPLPAEWCPLTFLRDGSLATYGAGCVLWPRRAPETEWQFGPPRYLGGAGKGPVTASAGGEWLAYRATDNRVVARRADDPTRRATFGPHPGLNHNGLALSPDARWAATGTWGGGDAAIWEVATGRLAHHFRGGNFQVCFSADGRRLATREFHGELKLWNTDGWRQLAARREWEGPIGFTPDSRLLAAGCGPGLVRLLDANDGSPVVALETPHATDSPQLAFDPSGGKLAIGTVDQFVYLWDLNLVRRRLAELGLPDWVPTPPPASAEPRPPPAITVRGSAPPADPSKAKAAEQERLLLAVWINPFDAESHYELGRMLEEDKRYDAAARHYSAALALWPDRVGARRARCRVRYLAGQWADAAADADRVLAEEPGDWRVRSYRANARQVLGRHPEAVADFDRLVEAIPGESTPLLGRADSLAALGRDAEADADRGRSLAAARKWVEVGPRDPLNWYLLGVSLYRTGGYAKAADVLEKTRSLPGGDKFVAAELYLAMSYHRAGRRCEAIEARRRADSWLPRLDQLTAYERHLNRKVLAEADGVLSR